MVVHFDKIEVKFEYQGHFCEIDYSDRWAPNSFIITYDINKIIKAKVILRSRLFQNQTVIVSVNFYPEAGGGPLTECILVCNSCL